MFGSLFEAEGSYHLPRQTVVALGLDETLVNYWKTKWGFKVLPRKVETKLKGTDGKPVTGWILYTDSAALKQAVDRNTIEMFNQRLAARNQELNDGIGFFDAQMGAITTRKADIFRPSSTHPVDRPLSPPLASHAIPETVHLPGRPPGKLSIDFTPTPEPIPQIQGQTRLSVFQTIEVGGQPVRIPGKVEIANFTKNKTMVQIGRTWVSVLDVKLRATFEQGPVRSYETTVHLPIYTGGVSADFISGVQTPWAPAIRLEAGIPAKTNGIYDIRPVADGRGYTEVLTLWLREKLLLPDIMSRTTGFNWDEFHRRYPDQITINGRTHSPDQLGIQQPLRSDFFYPAGYVPKDATYALWDRLGGLPKGSVYARGAALLSTLQRIFDAQLNWPILFSTMGIKGKPPGSGP
jgi:hypothetical protein